MTYAEAIQAYMATNAPEHPFKVRAAMHELAAALRDEGGDAGQVARIQGAAVSLGGVCSLHLDNLWSATLRATAWWRRGKLAATEDAWRAEKFNELHGSALMDINKIRNRHALQ